jgi:hypothetical protein
MELLQLVDVRVEEASRPLREEVATLKLLLAHAGVSLESMVVCTPGAPGLVFAQDSFLLDSSEQLAAHVGDSLEPEPTEACTYSCFSARASLCTLPVASMIKVTEVAAPDPQIMPELLGQSGESSVVLPMELGSLEALAVATTPLPPLSEPCEPTAHVDSGGLDASATLSSVAIRHVVSLNDETVKKGVLAPNSEALFAKELSDLLVSLEAASPGYGMEIASVLAGKASEDIIRKVEKSLKSKRKNRVVSWKFSRPLD